MYLEVQWIKFSLFFPCTYLPQTVCFIWLVFVWLILIFEIPNAHELSILFLEYSQSVSECNTGKSTTFRSLMWIKTPDYNANSLLDFLCTLIQILLSTQNFLLAGTIQFLSLHGGTTTIIFHSFPGNFTRAQLTLHIPSKQLFAKAFSHTSKVNNLLSLFINYKKLKILLQVSVLKRSKEDKIWICYIKACTIRAVLHFLKGSTSLALEFINIHPFETFD